MKKMIKIFLKTIFIILCLFMIIGSLGTVILSTQKGQTFAISRLTAYLEQHIENDISLSIDSVEFLLPFGFRLHGVTVNKEDRPFVSLKQAEIFISPLPLLSKKLVIPYFSINDIVIAPEYLHKEISSFHYDAEGSLTSHPMDGIFFTHLEAAMVDDKGNHIPINLTITGTQEKAAIAINSKRLPIQLLNIPYPLPADLIVDLKAQTSIPLAFVKNPTTPLEGEFTLTAASETAKQFLGVKTTCQGAFILFPDMHLAIPKMVIENSIGRVNSSFRLSSDYQINELVFDGTLFSLSFLEPILGRSLSGTIEFNGQPEKDASWTPVKLNVQGRNLEVDHRHVGDIFSQLTCQYHDNLIEFSELTLAIPESTLRLSGHLAISLSTYLLNGSIVSELENLDILNQWLGTSLKGSGKADLTFLPNWQTEKQDLLCSLTAAKIKWDTIRANETTAEIDWKDIWNRSRSMHIDSNITDLKTPIGAIDKLHIDTTLNESETLWPLTASASGLFNNSVNNITVIADQPFREDWTIHLSGGWLMQGDIFQGRLTSGEGFIAGNVIQLKNDVSLSVAHELIEMTPFHLVVGETELEGQVSLNAKDIHASLQGDHIPAGLINLLYPEVRLKGEGAFKAILEGSKENPEGHVRIDLNNIKLLENAFKQLPPVQSSIQLSINKNGLHVNGVLTGLSSHPIELKGTLPVSIAEAPALFMIDRKAPIDLSFSASGEIEPYLHLFPIDTGTIRGQAAINMALTGTINAPQFTGNGRLTHGYYDNAFSGTAFKNVQAELEAEGSTIFLRNLQVHDANNGTFEGTGTLSLDSEKHFPFEIDLNVTNADLVNLDYGKILTNGHLNFSGSMKEGKLTGSLNVEKAAITIPEEMPTQIKTIEVTYINQQDKEDLPISKPAAWPVSLNLQLKVPQTLSIQGKGLSSKWEGDILVTGSPADPLLNGELRNIKGEYDFNGKLFKIERGSIQFAGSFEKKTTLYLAASKDIDRITAEIILKGPIKKPVLTFHSNPPMTQKEILSYILFNRGISDINPTQGAQLNQSIVTLSSKQQNEGFLHKLRSTVGIDRVDISRSGTDDNNAISLQVGKYLSKGIFVSVNKSINADSNSLGIEAALSRHFKVKAEISDSAQDRLLIEWKKDY